MVPYNLRVHIEREARRMAGYRQGRDIAERFLGMLENPGIAPLTDRIAQFVAAESDPRAAEIFARLGSVLLGERGMAS
jgi:hypothetical protein